MRFVISFLFVSLNLIGLEANNIQVIKGGPIHEAFVTKESGQTILQAVPDKPPSPITEQTPQNEDDKSIWIPGYWAWIRDVGDYIWVSGIWRRPPLEHHWIPGYWKNYPQGWVWFPGFWSQIPESEFEFISQAPPDQLDEKVPTPAQPVNGYFWVPGYWEWDSEFDAFHWLSGRWELLDESLMYVPAQYYWREDGYLLVPGFWDWPIEKRGFAFADITISPDHREYAVYEPREVVEPLLIMELLYPQWPSYQNLFRYHFYFHQNAWLAWGTVPPWWSWYSWWCLPSQDVWWLWWWWSHPGYPNPSWIDSSVAKVIVPPSKFVLKIMKEVKPPAIVSANGVVGSKELITAIEKATGKKSPILSSDPKQVEQIQDLADPTTPRPPYLKPTGEDKVIQMPPKPNSGSSSVKLKLPPGRVKLPPRPIELALIAQEDGTPVQGSSPDFQYPQIPIQTQHQNQLMTKPQPQVNPAGPSPNYSEDYKCGPSPATPSQPRQPNPTRPSSPCTPRGCPG